MKVSRREKEIQNGDLDQENIRPKSGTTPE